MRTNTTQHLHQRRHQRVSVCLVHLMSVAYTFKQDRVSIFPFNEIIILIISVFLHCTACAKMKAYAFKLVVSGTVGCSVSTVANVSSYITSALYSIMNASN